MQCGTLKKFHPRQSFAKSALVTGVLAGHLISAHSVSRAAEQNLVAVNARLAYRDKEQDLLHLRADLSAVKCLDPKSGRFVPNFRLRQRLTIVNLWSLHCAPCMDEFRKFRNIVQYVRSKDHPIDFLFIADPPEDNPEAAVLGFWSNPTVSLPDARPCISVNGHLRNSIDFNGVPVTLLLDHEGIVRHSYIGSIEGRKIAAVIERLLDILPDTLPSTLPRPKSPLPPRPR